MTDDALEKAHQAATPVRADYDRAATAIRENRALSDEGKRDALADHWAHHKRQLDAIQTQYRQERQLRRDQLEAKVFRPDVSLSATATETAARTASYRDALARADDLDDDAQAQAALQRALRTGDDDLVRAVGVVGMERGWINALNAYIEARPDEGSAIEGLFTLRHQDSDAAYLMREAMALEPTAPHPAPERDVHAFEGSPLARQWS